MYNYDADIIKRNIAKIMSNKGISQTAIAESIGVAQSRVSKCLKNAEKDMFTLEQIINIANVLEVSLDDIIGTVNKKDKYSMYSFFENAAISNPSMADFAAIFFNIYQEIPTIIETEDYPRDDCKDPRVIFCCEGIAEFLEMFGRVSLASHNSGMGDKLLRVWINDYINENQKYDVQNMPCKAFVETTMGLTDTYRDRECWKKRNFELIRPELREKLGCGNFKFEVDYDSTHEKRVIECTMPDGTKRTLEP